MRVNGVVFAYACEVVVVVCACLYGGREGKCIE